MIPWQKLLTHKERQLSALVSELQKRRLSLKESAEILGVHIKTAKRMILSLKQEYPEYSLTLNNKQISCVKPEVLKTLNTEIWYSSKALRLLIDLLKNCPKKYQKTTDFYRTMSCLNGFLKDFDLSLNTRKMCLVGEELKIRQLFLDLWSAFPAFFDSDKNNDLIEESGNDIRNNRLLKILKFRSKGPQKLVYPKLVLAYISKRPQLLISDYQMTISEKIYLKLFEFSEFHPEDFNTDDIAWDTPIYQKWLLNLFRYFPELNKYHDMLLKILFIQTAKLIVQPLVYKNSIRKMYDQIHSLPRMKARLNSVVQLQMKEDFFNQFSKERLSFCHLEIIQTFLLITEIESPCYIMIDEKFTLLEQDRIADYLKYHFISKYNLVFLSPITNKTSEKVFLYIEKRTALPNKVRWDSLKISSSEIDEALWIELVREKLEIWRKKQKAL